MAIMYKIPPEKLLILSERMGALSRLSVIQVSNGNRVGARVSLIHIKTIQAAIRGTFDHEASRADEPRIPLLPAKGE